MPYNVRYTNLIRNALENLAFDSGASRDYAKGMLVGLVSGLQAMGVSHTDCCAMIADSWKRTFRKECIPDEWIDLIQRHLKHGMVLTNFHSK